MNEARTSAPTLVEIMSHDQARVNSLQHRLRVMSDRNSLDDSKATLPAKPRRSISSGNYIFTLGFETPKKDLTLTFDTRSDVAWMQCQPCFSDASDVGIFGDVQQQTLDVVYDVAGGKLGFGTGGCS
ncbi:hypothetical protein RHMOL_Rhmol02G0273000 [Rhododendron molle]|uniref:Uncharacterized protein n=1 Tax=Rhododendron molle TaxID=49168 RepID=A0ACC0PWE4_RHOML|nr:hypothetical protein RHMOL_Rhmol02G0273000 [Rhododendron molle]